MPAVTIVTVQARRPPSQPGSEGEGGWHCQQHLAPLTGPPAPPAHRPPARLQPPLPARQGLAGLLGGSRRTKANIPIECWFVRWSLNVFPTDTH